MGTKDKRGSENVIKNEIKDGSITILQQVSEPIVTSAINLKIRTEEPNIQTFNEFLQNAWPVNTSHHKSFDIHFKEIVK